MKYLLVLAIVLIAIGIWRSNRARRHPPGARSGGETPKAIEMVSCDLCGMHCPRADSLRGKRGVYCSALHRSQAEP
jgi:uncharacterized protein